MYSKTYKNVANPDMRQCKSLTLNSFLSCLTKRCYRIGEHFNEDAAPHVNSTPAAARAGKVDDNCLPMLE